MWYRGVSLHGLDHSGNPDLRSLLFVMSRLPSTDCRAVCRHLVNVTSLHPDVLHTSLVMTGGNNCRCRNYGRLRHNHWRRGYYRRWSHHGRLLNDYSVRTSSCVDNRRTKDARTKDTGSNGRSMVVMMVVTRRRRPETSTRARTGTSENGQSGNARASQDCYSFHVVHGTSPLLFMVSGRPSLVSHKKVWQ